MKKEFDKTDVILYKVIEVKNKTKERNEKMTEKRVLTKEESKKFFTCLRVFLREEKRYDRKHCAFIIAKMMNFI